VLVDGVLGTAALANVVEFRPAQLARAGRE
jgi:hypothetical protein